MLEEYTSLEHIVIHNNIFSSNGALYSGGAIGITFERELFNIVISSNEFLGNTS